LPVEQKKKIQEINCKDDYYQVYAVDASEDAAAWAKYNVQRYNLESRVQVSFSLSALRANGTLLL